jgi:hypothetical protein
MLAGHTGGVRSVAFFFYGNRLVSASVHAAQAVSGQYVFVLASHIISHILLNLFYFKSIANPSNSYGIGIDFLIFLIFPLPFAFAY